MIFGMVNVAIAVIVKEEKVLLIKRERGVWACGWSGFKRNKGRIRA